MLTEWDYYSIKQNIALQKEVRRLQIALRDERRKK